MIFLQSLFRSFFSFDGRLNRRQYWRRIAVLYIAIAPIVFVLAQEYLSLKNDGPNYDSGGVFNILLPYMVLWLVSAMAVAARRLHDLGKNAYLVIMLLIPSVNILILILLGFLQGDEDANRFGTPS
ncbi:MAG: DUF805 domain-containing protein [Hyphomicrobiales bacterium]